MDILGELAMVKEELFSLNFVAIRSLWILKTRLSRLLYMIGLLYEINNAELRELALCIVYF